MWRVPERGGGRFDGGVVFIDRLFVDEGMYVCDVVMSTA